MAEVIKCVERSSEVRVRCRDGHPGLRLLSNRCPYHLNVLALKYVPIGKVKRQRRVSCKDNGFRNRNKSRKLSFDG